MNIDARQADLLKEWIEFQHASGLDMNDTALRLLALETFIIRKLAVLQEVVALIGVPREEGQSQS